jgi:hypothetical protein
MIYVGIARYGFSSFANSLIKKRIVNNSLGAKIFTNLLNPTRFNVM